MPTRPRGGNPIFLDVATGEAACGLLAGLAYRLGVRRSPAAPAFTVPADESTRQAHLSHYVARDAIDETLRAAIQNKFGQRGVHVIVLDGFSYTGKSRALLQALLSQRRMFRFLAPATPADLVAVLNEAPGNTSLHPDRPTMLWLDPLEHFSEPPGSEWWGTRLAQHATRTAPIVLLAGLGGTAGLPMSAKTRAFLEIDHPLDRLRDLKRAGALTLVEMLVNERGFEAESSLRDISRTYDAAAQSRPGPWEVAARNGGFLRALTHAGHLERRYRHGEPDRANIDPRGQAVAWAVMAWRRVVQSDDLVDLETIERLVEHSPSGSRGGIASADELQAAIDWACQRTAEQASSLVLRARHADAGEAFRAEAFLAQALVQPSEITDPVWEIIEKAAPTDRLTTIRNGRNASTVQEHGSPREPATAVDIELRGSIGTRGSLEAEEGPAREIGDIRSVAFLTTRGFEGRLRPVDEKVEITLWSAPADAATARTVGVRLIPAGPHRAHPAQPNLPIVATAQSADGYWQIATNVTAPQSETDWHALTKSLRIAVLLP